MKKVQLYLLAGLGFDERIFYELNIENAQLNYLEWPEPGKNESFENYTKRIASQISTSDTPIVLVGHSFGGIVVQEIAKSVDAAKVIIISSIKSKEEMPITLKFLKMVPLYKFFNKKVILLSFPIWAVAFGYNSKKGRKLFKQMIGACSDNYFKWSMHQIVNYSGDNKLLNLTHIHGTRDKTFPISLIRDPIIIQDGSHFMVFSKAEEVSNVINDELKKLFSPDRIDK
jgi:pimeloyl-ACP methyl ester carboxylesterase